MRDYVKYGIFVGFPFALIAKEKLHNCVFTTFKKRQKKIERD